MKKLFLIGLLFLTGKAFATVNNDYKYILTSSYTEAGLPGAVMFASGTIQITGITISSPTSNTYVTFFRSTSSVFTPDIATQTLVSTDYQSFNNAATFIPMFDMQNDSYTYIGKLGTAKVTIWFRCVEQKSNPTVINACPGLRFNGQR